MMYIYIIPMLSTSANLDSAGSNRCHARPDVARLRRARRTRLPAVRPDRRTAVLSSVQPALQAHLDHCHDQPGVRRMAKGVRRPEEPMMLLSPIDLCATPGFSIRRSAGSKV